ncbi:MAG: hypothetical protein AB1489_27255 [Acidobacteriota bacterium]
MNNELSQAILAVDKLNSWVRSRSYKGHYDRGPKDAVYWLKRCALIAAHKAQLPWSNCLIDVVVKCRDCSGTGRYYHWDWDEEFDHCYRCSNTGQARLTFVETQIDCGNIICWHTPRYKFPIYGVELANKYEESNWQPNTPGKDLSPDEAAKNLNIAESYFTNRPGIEITRWGQEYDVFNYNLYIGKTDSRRCSLCGAMAEERAYMVRRDRIIWEDYACDKCNQKYREKGRSTDIFEVFPVPAYLIEHPDIQDWINRNHVVLSQVEVMRR